MPLPEIPSPRHPWRLALAALCLLFLLANAPLLIGLDAPNWDASTFFGPGYSDRSGPLPKEVAVHDNALHPFALTTAASPYLHVLATLYSPARWAPTDGSSAGAYAGVVIPAFAVFALCRSPRRRWLWWLAGTSLFLLVTATDELPLRGWLYDLLPWERFARHGAQRKDLALFVLAVLALHGAPRADALELREERRRPPWGGLVAVAGLSWKAPQVCGRRIAILNVPLKAPVFASYTALTNRYRATATGPTNWSCRSSHRVPAGSS